MNWKTILKISEGETSDFSRFGQPEWDEGLEEIKDNKEKEALKWLLEQRPRYADKLKESEHKQLIAHLALMARSLEGKHQKKMLANIHGVIKN